MAGEHAMRVAKHRAQHKGHHHKSHPLSEKTREKIAAALRGRKHPKRPKRA